MFVEERIRLLIGNKKDLLIGFAHLTNLIPKIFGVYCYAAVVGQKLDDFIIDSIVTGPTIEYRDHYEQSNHELSRLVHKIAAELNTMDISTIIIEPTVNDDELDDVYYRTLRTDFSHKMAATQAGLGWIGKTDLFISEQFGPRVRLATILSDYPFELTNPPITESKCGNCNICVEKCPAQAANGKLWNINTDRDEFYNPFKCREKCQELSYQNINESLSICGICISVCPRGKNNN